MPKICYVDKTFRVDTMRVIEQANDIIDDYAADGYDLTLRQLYYQFVARDLIPNKQTEYKRLGGIINDARLAGLIDWDAITDRTRNLRSNPHWDSPASIVRSCAQQFRYDLWEDQPVYVEVWIEKDALIGVLDDVCSKNDVPYFSCRGYPSQSEVWGAAQRIGDSAGRDKDAIILHLGDHDPSGIDMTRDLEDRLNLFTPGSPIKIRRIALNMDQVNVHNPPPNPAKVTDSRYEGYRKQHGEESWELDALNPNTLSDLIQRHVDALRDHVAWNDAVDRQDAARKELRTIADEMED